MFEVDGLLFDYKLDFPPYSGYTVMMLGLLIGSVVVSGPVGVAKMGPSAGIIVECLYASCEHAVIVANEFIVSGVGGGSAGIDMRDMTICDLCLEGLNLKVPDSKCSIAQE